MNSEPVFPGRRSTNLLRWLRAGCALVLASVLPLHAAPSQAADPSIAERVESPSRSVDELKRDYLLCNRAALEGRLDNTMIMHCSLIYEQLKKRAFGGDFGRLHAWSVKNPVRR